LRIPPFSAMPIDDEGDDDGDAIAQLVKEAVRTVQRMTPLKESTPVITSMSEEGAYLTTLRNKLVEVSFLTHYHRHRRELIFIVTLPLRSARPAIHLNKAFNANLATT
jgi:hypothetical protein